jgi:C-terminal processing protease CtpA/Prc
MDIVGLTLRPLNDGKYQVIGVVKREGIPVIDGIESGDILLQIDDLTTTGATMGTVVDALRGKPGEIYVLKLERDGKPFTVEATVERIL